MNFISHRGYWKESNKKNTKTAFKDSFELGFGTETDVRDLQGDLVISHDMPLGGEISFEEFLNIYKESYCTGVLALNIKSDGLQKPIKSLLEEYQVSNYFLFDMSIPDAVMSLKSGLNCFTRQSEYEPYCTLYENVIGVWMDEFENDWINVTEIKKHLENGKKVCIVSPELHGRDPKKRWLKYRELNHIQGGENITLCTDLPEIAKEFISNGQD